MRVLATFTGAFALGIFLAQYLLPVQWLLPLAVGCFLVACAALLLPPLWRRRVLLAAVALSLALGWDWLYIRQVQRPMEALADTEALAEMTLCEYATETNYGARVTVTLKDRPWGKAVYYGPRDLLDLSPGQTVSDRVRFESAAHVQDDDITTFTSKGVFLLAYTQEAFWAKAGSADSPRWWPVRLGQMLRQQIGRVFDGDTAAFLTAILTGDKSGLSETASADLSEAGLYHILAVSGMHCMFLLSMVRALAGKHRRRLVAAWAIPMLVFYALLTGGSPSVVRACIMVAFFLAAPLFRRDSDGPTALTAALFLILLANPFAAASVSLQLSFGAMAGILWLPQRLYKLLCGTKKHGKVFRFTATSFSATMGALVFTFPLSAYYFGTLVLVSPVSNLLCLWAASGIFLLGLGTVLLSFLSLPLGLLLAVVPKALIGYVLETAHLLAALPYHALYVTNPYLLPWLVYAYLLFAAAWCLGVRSGRKCALAAVLAMLTLTACVRLGAARWQQDDLHILALDVGQGACTLLASQGSYALVDCGSGNSWYDAGTQAVALLKTMGCDSLDYLVLTHYDLDHISGVTALLARLPVKVLLAPEPVEEPEAGAEIFAAAEANGAEVRLLRRDSRLPFGEAALTVYSPVGDGGDNQHGLSVLCTCDDFDLLITGDMDSATERALLDAKPLPDIEALVVGHHGSASSSSEELLEALTPETAVISVGSNSYGHPTQDAMLRLSKAGATVYRTDLQGTVQLTVNRGA